MKATVVFPIQNNQVILAIKKNKIGAGKWNGFGGKPEPGDTSIFHTAARELFEETGKGIVALEENLIPIAYIHFFFFSNHTNVPNWSVVFFTVNQYTGVAKTTNEMENPTLFPLDKIPYNSMLPADREFVPLILKGNPFIGNVRFNEAMTSVQHSEFIPTTPEDLLQAIIT